MIQIQIIQNIIVADKMRRSSKTNRQVAAEVVRPATSSSDLLTSHKKQYSHSRKRSQESSYSRQDLLQLHCDLDTIPQPERQPPRQPVPQSADFVSIVVQEVVSHSLRVNRKARVRELSRMDLLASFEEVMISRYPTMSKEVNQRIYKRLLDELCITHQQQSIESADSINQDLHFDFQGSFAANETAQKKNTLMSSLHSEDFRPQRLVQKVQFPQLQLVSSQASSTGEVMTPQMRNQSILSQIASMTNQNVDGRNQSKISLPKLSFNDLYSGSNEKILIQENYNKPTLFAEHMLASSRSAQNLQNPAPQMLKFPKVQLIRDSELTSTVDSHLQSKMMRSEGNEDYDLVNYFPVHAQLPPSLMPKSKSTERITVRKEFNNNTHQILAESFNRRKLIVKAWKAILYSRMHTIQNQHALKLSRAYHSRRLQHIAFRGWNYYIKNYLPEEKNSLFAYKKWERTIQRSVLQALRDRVNRRKTLIYKLISTIMVLKARRLRRYMAGFKVGIAHAQISTLRKQQAMLQFLEHLKVKTMKAFAFYSIASKRDRELKKSMKYFRNNSLTSRTLLGFKLNISINKKKVLNTIAARKHYTHYQSIILNKAFFVLLEHSRQKRNKHLANHHQRHWLQFQHFKLLKFFTLLRRCQRNQIRQVSNLQDQRLQVKVFQAFQESIEETRARVDMLRMWNNRLKMRKIMRRLHNYADMNKIRYPPTNGNFLRVCEMWLRGSFGDLMQTVWKEFPKQKLSINSSSGEPHFLLNYLGLSRVPRYRQFFYIVNILLRKHLMSICLKSLKTWTAHIRKFRLRREYNIKNLCLRFMYKISQKARVGRLMVQEREKRRDRRVMECAWYCLCKEVAVKRAFYRTLQERRRHIIMEHMGQWLETTQKVRKVKMEDQQSMKIYRHRSLSNYLSIWLHELHVSLKLKHLNSLCDTFQRRSGLRRSYFVEWVNQSRKSRYLSAQEKSITTHQLNLLVYRAFNALSTYTRKRRASKRKEQGADQEYKWWLAKRAISYWLYAKWSQNKKKELNQTVAQEYLSKVKRSVIQTFQVYSRYRQDKRIMDHMLTKAVQGVSKKRYIKGWKKQMDLHNAVKLLGYSLQRVQISCAYRKIKNYLTMQDAFEDHLRTKSDIYYRLLQPFKSWKRFSDHRKLCKSLQIQAQAKHQLITKHSNFQEWLQLQRNFRKTYIMYAFLVIELKNRFLAPILEGMRAFVLHKRMKRNARALYVSKTKRGVFNCLKLRTMKSVQVFTAYDQVKKGLRSKNLINAYARWRQIFKENIYLQELFVIAQKRMLSRVFSELVQYKTVKSNQKLEQAYIEEELSQALRQIAVKQLIVRLKGRTNRRQKLRQASQWHSQYVFRTAMKVWATYYKKYQVLIKKYLSFKGQRDQNTKTLMMKQWVSRSANTLKKLYAVKKMLKIRQKKLIRARFQSWFSELKFFRLLDQRVAQYTKKHSLQDKRQGILKMREQSRLTILDRNRTMDIKAYYMRKTQSRVIRVLFQYKEHRKAIDSLKVLAQQHYLNAIEKYTFSLFRDSIKTQLQLKHATYFMRQSRVKRHGKRIIKTLRSHKNACRQYQVLQSFSKDLLYQRLMTKGIQSLSIYARYQSEVRKMIYHFRVIWQQKSQARAFAGIALYSQIRQELKLKREALFQVLQKIDREAISIQVLQSLKQNACASQQENESALTITKRRKLRKFYDVFPFNQRSERRLRSLYYSLRNHQQQKKISQLFTLWHKSYLNKQLIKNAKDQKILKTQRSVFIYLARCTKLSQILNKVKIQGVLKMKLSAFQGFLQYMSQKRSQAMKETASELHYLHQICRRAIQSFQIIKARKKTLAKALVERDKRLQARAVMALSYAKSRKQAYYWFLTSSLMKKRQSYLGAWLDLLRYRKERSFALGNLLSSLHVKKLKSRFMSWKKESAFTNLISVIYRHRYEDENRGLQQSVIREWRRYIVFHRNKSYLKNCLQTKQRKRILDKVLHQWKSGTRDFIFSQRMQGLFVNRLSEVFESLSNYSQINGKITQIASELIKKSKRQTKLDFLIMWRFAKDQHIKERYSLEFRQKHLIKIGLQALKNHRIQKLEEKYQMLKVISHFSERRPQALLMFSKAFFQLNSMHDQLKICSTALAKYIIEKWKNVRPQLKSDNEKINKANRLYLFKLFTKGFQSLREGAEVVAHKRSLNLSVKLFVFKFIVF